MGAVGENKIWGHNSGGLASHVTVNRRCFQSCSRTIYVEPRLRAQLIAHSVRPARWVQTAISQVELLNFETPRSSSTACEPSSGLPAKTPIQ